MPTTRKPDYLILVNSEHRLPDNFEETIELVPAENAAGDKYIIEKGTYEAFLRMREDLIKNEGVQIEMTSVYRNLEEQQAAFDEYLEEFGLEYATKYVAKPGHSEHHTGFALDVGFIAEGKFLRLAEELFNAVDLYAILHKNLGRYGFILRYPESKQPITKINYEPWHIRYIGSAEIAQEIADKDICFEEYWQKA